MSGNSDPRADRPRIFCVGLNKTGTSTFHEAMSILGFTSLHWGGPPIRDKVQTAIDAGEPLLSHLDDRFDAFSDILLLSTNFELLDRQYPGSRFVLTVRPIDDWLHSRRRHVENNIRRKAEGTYDGDFLVVDPEAWRSEWKRHVAGVREYFHGRDDFLEIDLTCGRGWGPLCAVLRVPEPTVPFPWANPGAS
jgi:hypothetical protein